ncbi:hypothetical protein ACJX0J_039209, partial [Zea mays]
MSLNMLISTVAGIMNTPAVALAAVCAVSVSASLRAAKIRGLPIFFFFLLRDRSRRIFVGRSAALFGRIVGHLSTTICFSHTLHQIKPSFGVGPTFIQYSRLLVYLSSRIFFMFHDLFHLLP